MTVSDESGTKGESNGRQIRGATARGAKVVLVGQVARIVLQMVSVVVLARLLLPSDYGLFAFAVAIISLGEVFRDFGLSTAAIQAPTLSAGQRTNLFWVNVGLGVVLAVACWFAAPLISSATGHEESGDLARAMAVVFVLNGALAQYRADLNRSLRFVALTVTDIAGTAIGIVAAITAAVAGLGYWSLAIQQIVGVAAILVLAVVAAGWLPRLPDRTATIRPFLRFGIGMVGTQLVGYGNNYVDTLTIGVRFGAADLGVYNRAFQVLMVTLNQMRNPTTTVALPVLSRLTPGDRETDEMIVRGQAALGYTLVAGTAFAVGAAVPIVDLALGDGWEEAAPLFAVLGLAGALSTVGFVAYWVFVSRALTGRLFQYSLLTFATRVTFVLVGSQWGLLGVAFGYALAPVLTLPLGYVLLSRWTPLPLGALNAGAVRVMAAASVAAAVSFGAQQATVSLPSVVQLVACAAATMATYAALAVLPPVRRDLQGVYRFAKMAFGR